MSGGNACKCSERRKPMNERGWECSAYKCNYSAFNGYHRTRSDYSTMHCMACGAVWRTKAAWAIRFIDTPPERQARDQNLNRVERPR